MAKITYLQDDFDGTIDDTVASRKVMLEEGTLTIDLSEANYALMMNALAPFIEKGEWTVRETGNDENTLIREWARENGKEVSRRGRLSQDLVSEYREYLKSREASTQPTVEPDSNGTPVAEVNDPYDTDTDADNGDREPATSVNA